MGGMSHESYLDEPAHIIDWMLALEGMESERQKDQIERERAKHRAAGRA